MVIATCMELLGAMTLGSYNADTIRGSIINVSHFNNKGGALMLAMLCAVIASSLFNFLSNRYGWATSSTHAIIGGLIGVGVASGAGVTWGYAITYNKDGSLAKQNGLGSVVASFAISPALAASFGALVYLLVYYTILRHKGPASFTWALRSIPFWYGLVAAFEAWLIGWKSPRIKDKSVLGRDLNDGETVGLFFGTFGIVGLLSLLFISPYVYRTVWFGWSGLRLYHLPLMILPDSMLLKILPGADAKAPWFDDRHLRNEEVPPEEDGAWCEKDQKVVAAKRGIVISVSKVVDSSSSDDPENSLVPSKAASKGAEEVSEPTKPVSPWTATKNAYFAIMRDPSASVGRKAWATFKFLFFWGVDREIAEHGIDKEEITTIHDNAPRHYGKTEMVFRFLQILTSSIACFAHGANDVGISVGPLSTLFYYWQRDPIKGGNVKAPSSSVVLDWQLAVAAICLVLGLWFYGYNMMRVLGNRLTFHSPTRGFSMELGAAIAVLIAARNGIPVSTTNCIVGSTIGVGIASSGVKSVNWKLALFTLSTWIFTIPFCALVSGCVYAFATYSPHVNCLPISVGLGTNMTSFKIDGKTYTSAQTLYPAGC